MSVIDLELYRNYCVSLGKFKSLKEQIFFNLLSKDYVMTSYDKSFIKKVNKEIIRLNKEIDLLEKKLRGIK